MQPKPRIIEVLQKGLKCSDKLAQGSIIVSALPALVLNHVQYRRLILEDSKVTTCQ